ncbi:MAG: D-inositol-3-phosphate glycosyltransferase [Chlamydiae bacterium]|nr:D-inositol-3-phosphate glycosyltransferase [Chlamydiota bacterium]
MKIVKVIHGYPPRYSAGSEVYTKTLCHELVRQGHEVIVFSREENAYKQEYSITWEVDPDCEAIKLCLINMAHSRDGYQHTVLDRIFGQVLDDQHPDLVHVGHLNHLSTSIISEAHKRNIPIVFTLHDFWLMCPRGQFLQTINSKTSDLYPVCDSQDDKKCAQKCYWRYFSTQNDSEDLSYWTEWVGKRMNHVRKMCSVIDLFIAPSRYLMNRFTRDFGIDSEKILYLDYGFHLERLPKRKRRAGKNFVFGYIGTHKQAKGIHHLIHAFNRLQGRALLKIWGSPIEPFTQSLKAMIASMPIETQKRIEWMGGYRNEQITSDVFNHIDTIVVPSIWGENSPLVIHEAIEAQLPVITANYGGMKEYIHHEINGLLFTHRDVDDLRLQMDRMQRDPDLAKTLGQGGYIQSSDKKIPCIEEHTKKIQNLYQIAIKKRREPHDSKNRSLAHHV